jgi:hypothetical protein
MNLADFQAFVSSVAGVKVIRANQSKERPARPYATWNIISQVRQGQKETSLTSSGLTVDEETALPYVYNVEIQFYTSSDKKENNGKLARELANDFLLYLSTTAGIDAVVEFDFKILNHSDYANEDLYLSTEFERRAVIELQVFSRESIVLPVSTIDRDQTIITLNLV